MPQTALDALFNPSSIAVVGASRDSKKVGNISLRNIINSGYKGKVYPVNPKHTEIYSHKCYKTINDLPETPQLLIVAIPAEFVLQILTEYGERGLKDHQDKLNAVVYTSGFKETGTVGAQLENNLKQITQKYKINLLGPNCFGFLNTKAKLNTTFGKVVREEGIMRFISQSGAIAASLFDYASNIGLGFDQFITLGNKAGVTENDILEYWLDTDLENSYAPIGMYLESINDGEKFLELAKKITITSPMFILKPGKSSQAQQAMHSHTGSLAGEDYILQKALESAGIIRCYALEDVFDLTKALSWQLFPTNKKVAIISNAGGPAVISADIVAEYGLELAQIGPDERKYLSAHLPKAASLVDPIDLLGDALADRYEIALTEVLKQEDVGSVVVILTPQVMTQIEETAQKIAQIKEKFNKPVLCAFIGGGDVTKGEEILTKHKILCYRYPERAIRVLGQIWSWKKWQKDLAHNKGIFVKDIKLSLAAKLPLITNKALSPDDADRVFRQIGMTVPQSFVAKTVEEAVTGAKKIGYPVVAKVCLPGIVHKALGGGVSLNIKSDSDMTREFNRIKGADPSANVFVQKQVPQGAEFIIGVKKDISFGYFLLLGAGGIHVDLIDDKNATLFSETYPDLLLNIGSTVAYKLTENKKAILDVVDKMIGLINSNPVFSEIEINPLIVTDEDAWAVDGKGVML